MNIPIREKQIHRYCGLLKKSSSGNGFKFIHPHFRYGRNPSLLEATSLADSSSKLIMNISINEKGSSVTSTKKADHQFLTSYEFATLML